MLKPSLINFPPVPSSKPRATSFITGLTPFGYLRGPSHARRYQNIFLQTYGKELKGRVVELAGEKHYSHQRFFPHAQPFVCTNIDRDYDEYLDVTKMCYPDNSQDGFVCVSALEHVYDIHKAFAEIHRCLKPGGRLLLDMPFMFPVHDKVDYWRLTSQGLAQMLTGFEINELVHMGGALSTAADLLQRPKGSLHLRHLPSKLLGLLITIVGRPLEKVDKCPTLIGVLATKTH